MILPMFYREKYFFKNIYLSYSGNYIFIADINEELLKSYIKSNDFAFYFYYNYHNVGMYTNNGWKKCLGQFGIEVIDGEMNNGNGS